MPQFYFDLHQCGDVTLDEEGHEATDLDAARQQAIRCARDIMGAELAQGRLCLKCAIVIRDWIGATAMVVPFSEAVAVTLP